MAYTGNGPQADRGRAEQRAGRHAAGRRAVLKGGIGAALGVAGLTGATAQPSQAADVSAGGQPGRAQPRAAGAAKAKDLTGPGLTDQFGARWTDLAIPGIAPHDNTLFFLSGDTYSGDPNQNHRPGTGDWRSPVGLRSRSTDLNAVTVDGAVGDPHVRSLTGRDPDWETHRTTLPTDVFSTGGTMYMHVMLGKLFEPEYAELWKSEDNGGTWAWVREWRGDEGLWPGAGRRQKTFAVAGDGFCYVLSSVFNRSETSDLLLHRVPVDRLHDPFAYQPWGSPGNSGWAWGKFPTTVTEPRKRGEICFRAIGGKYAFTWLNMEPTEIRAQVFPLPTSDLTATPEQTLIVQPPPGGPEQGNQVLAPYGGFIFPGSTFDDFHIAVSQWHGQGTDHEMYRVMQYRATGLDV